ncbi:MAG: saccharopine dehydrogenase [Bacteroidetes bacterium RIFCSPLOWO2_12_FULL_35_15]|nr:MAG: saccharopine dehydrogenase [Bacteroidetes bacterium RIFCSPLOWO2_12_FULL_35_15]
MKKIIVLGAGMVGSAIAIDLAKKHSVTVADLSDKALEKLKQKNSQITTLQLNAKDKALLTAAITPFDLVVCAVPGFMGFETLKTIIETGKNVVDISFFPENSLDLDALAKQKGVTAIVDCGVAPGMDNIILGYYNEKMKLTDFECLVGGLPKVKKWPFNYKAPFSPIDVIEEYTRPARYVENGEIITKPAMSDVEHIEMEGVGTLETFNSDGLRSIIFTMPHIKNMKEKTMRYPGHIEKVLALRDSGFFSKEPVKINGVDIVPLDFTSKILFNEWKLGDTEEEITVMRVTVTGTENGVEKKISYHLYDEYNKETQTSSMARTTGYTCTAAVELVLKNLFSEKGVFPPELVGKHEVCFNHFMDHLKERGVNYRKEEMIITDSKIKI